LFPYYVFTFPTDHFPFTSRRTSPAAEAYGVYISQLKSLAAKPA